MPLNKLLVLLFLVIYACTDKRVIYNSLSDLNVKGVVISSKSYTDYSQENTNFCESNLILNSDSTYFSEFGCEGRSWISIGNWRYTNDSIELIPLTTNLDQPIKNVEYIGNISKRPTFLILDKTGKFFSDFILHPFKSHERNRDSFSPSDIFNGMSKKENYQFVDAKGRVSFNVRRFDSIAFPTMKLLPCNYSKLSTAGMTDTVKVILNFNSFYFYPFQFYDSSNYNAKYKLRNDTLFNDGRMLFRTIER